MKIKTITCHDVYNLGASLQAYALSAYLKELGHDVEIVDYKPDYLSRHYSLTYVPNPNYDKFFVRQLYLLAKLPSRLKALFGTRKKRFDMFRDECLNVTEKCYRSNKELVNNCPEADLFIAGSDQIWNPVFPNGNDPSFYLDFVPKKKRKISYAASFAIDDISDQHCSQIKPWLQSMDAISVREPSGLKILEKIGINGINVLDPVFLVNKSKWEKLAISTNLSKYIFIYDFDHSELIERVAKSIAQKKEYKIVSAFNSNYADIVLNDLGPREFLGVIMNAKVVITNSFHGTVFSLIFEKEFYVVNRTEKINTRMRDLLELLDLGDRLITDVPEATNVIDWGNVDCKLSSMIKDSKNFLNEQIEKCECDTYE